MNVEDTTPPAPLAIPHTHETPVDAVAASPILKTISAPYFSPFPTCSVTVIPAPTFTGKSWLVKQLLLHRHLYFSRPLTRVFIVLCNPKAGLIELEKEEQELKRQSSSLKLIPLSLDDYNIDLPEPGDVVIFEDVQFLTDTIRDTINVVCHHVGLAAVFVLCQGLLGCKKKFELLNYCHQAVLFMQSTSVARLANYIVQQFYQDKDTKEYLKTCIAYAERKRTVLLLELNSLSSKDRGYHIAISHLQQLMDPINPFAVIHPHPGRLGMYQNKFGHCETQFQDWVSCEEKVGGSTGATGSTNNDDDAVQTTSASALPLPPSSFMLVPAENVTSKPEQKTKEEGGDSTNGTDSSDPKQLWKIIVDTIEDLIEQNFHSRNWMLCKNVAREILRNKEFCILDEGRMLGLVSLPNAAPVSVIGLIRSATKQQSPSEVANPALLKPFVPYVKALLKNNCPDFYFKNKFFVDNGNGNGNGNNNNGNGGTTTKSKQFPSSRQAPLNRKHIPRTNPFSDPYHPYYPNRHADHSVRHYSNSSIGRQRYVDEFVGGGGNGGRGSSAFDYYGPYS